MNTFRRFVSFGAVFGAAAFFTGCVHDTSRTSRVQLVEEFAVVQSSTDQELTAAQMADLRKAVVNYLRGQGLTDGRTYYVRATFPSANGEEPQWAIVRIGSQAPTYTVLAAYPGRDDYYPYDFYRTNYSYSNYYPGYPGFSNWGYYDPFDYNYGYYSRPVVPRDHAKPGNSNQPGTTPIAPRNRWDRGPRDDASPTREPNPPRTPNAERWSRGHGEPRETQARPPTRSDRPDRTYTSPERSAPVTERSYAPLPERSSSPPPERAYTPPADTSSRSESPRAAVQDSRTQER